MMYGEFHAPAALPTENDLKVRNILESIFAQGYIWMLLRKPDTDPNRTQTFWPLVIAILTELSRVHFISCKNFFLV
jgi:hypothetical protein